MSRDRDMDNLAEIAAATLCAWLDCRGRPRKAEQLLRLLRGVMNGDCLDGIEDGRRLGHGHTRVTAKGGDA